MEEKVVKMGDIKPPLPIKTLPEAPPLNLKGILQWGGPALILGSLSIGGFEAYHAGYMGGRGFIGLFWLYLTSAFFQIFVNREIARWTMATGETIFQGFSRMRPSKFWIWFEAFWCFLSGFWPGWITGAAAAAAAVTGLWDWVTWSWIGIILVIIIFALSKYVYKALEYIMWIIWAVGVWGVVILTLLMTDLACFSDAIKGWLSFGYIPAGVTIAMIGPFLIQPAGLCWNAFHTYWVREKMMGMGAYIGRVTGLVAKPEEIPPVGCTFDAEDPNELKKWKGWMNIQTVTLVLFFVLIGGVLFTFFISLAGYTALVKYGLEVPSGWKIAIVIAEIFKKAYGPAFFSLFCFVIIFSLFDSQFATYDGLARVASDALWQEHPSISRKRPYRFWFFVFLGILVAASLAAIPVGTPYIIWLILNWLGMLNMPFYILAVLYLNNKYLPKNIRSKWYDNILNVLYCIILTVYFIIWTWDLYVSGGFRF